MRAFKNSHPVHFSYRPPLEVVVQSFVQQRLLAASLCTHQRDVDVVIRPCKPLGSSGNSHRVRGHGGGKMVSYTEDVCRRANLPQSDFSLKTLCTMTKSNFSCWASRNAEEVDLRWSLHPPGVRTEQRTAAILWWDLTNTTSAQKTGSDYSFIFGLWKALWSGPTNFHSQEYLIYPDGHWFKS